jgi:hypothetical protein
MGEAIIAFGFVAGGVATIYAALESLRESDAYFAQSRQLVYEIESYCSSYANVVRGIAPIGPAGERGGNAAGDAVRAYMARHNVTLEQVWAITERIRAFDLYNAIWRRVEGPARAKLREEADHVSGIGAVDADNVIDGTSHPRFYRPAGM